MLALAAGLRLWPLVYGAPVGHADEFSFVYWPLLFFDGDLNPDFFYYPHLHYYLLALIYGGYFLIQQMIAGWTLTQSVAFYYFWEPETVRHLARVTCALFGVATVGWAMLLARRVYGTPAGLAGGLFCAIGVLHVRQSPLAAVDVPMTFWYAGSVWGALRLLERREGKDYALAGMLVGLAAATKYQGALAGVAVIVAHLTAGCSLFDRRLWLAGAISATVFLMASPYVWLDSGRFLEDFGKVAAHVQQGRDDLGWGWWYHIKVSLRHHLGWPGLGLALVGAVLAGRRRSGRVLLAAFLGYYLIAGAGQLVFVRYALPLATLQAVLVAGGLQPLYRYRWSLLAVLAVAMGPLYGSVRVAQLLGATDTRTQARRWIEGKVSAGTTLCNFGGWAGDVPVETFEHLWWRTQYYVWNAGQRHLDEQLPFFDTIQPSPHYSYAIQFGNNEYMHGSTVVVEAFECGYVIVHRHPLAHSTVDGAFTDELARIGQRVAHFAPEGLAESSPVYDPLDAYYVPLGAFGSLRQTGPEIEIWRIPVHPLPDPRTGTARQALAGAYMSGASSALDLEDPWQFLQWAQRAVELDPLQRNTDYYLNAGTAYRRLGEPGQALAHWRQAAALDSKTVEAYYNMGLVHRDDLGDIQAAAMSWSKAVEIDPEHARSWNQLGQIFHTTGDAEKAIACWRRVIELDPEKADAFYNLGLVYQYDRGEGVTARRCWERAVGLDEGHWEARYNLARALWVTNEYEGALAHWERVVALRPDDARGHNGLGSTYKALGRYEEAVAAWKRAVTLDPDYATAYFNLGLTYLNNRGQPERAKEYLQKLLELQPDHPQAEPIRVFLLSPLSEDSPIKSIDPFIKK